MSRPEPIGVAARCAPAALARHDQLHATAAPVARWLLVEQPGPWGRDALQGSRLDRSVARRLAARAAPAGVRVMVIRRPGRSTSTGPRRWAYADSRLGQESIRWGRFGADEQLLDVALDGRDGEPAREPAYLVCTHARHDACCAIRGRPVAAALSALRPEAAWECSHTGGDRFAANVVLLPEGLYYGHLDPAELPGLIATHEAGRVDPTRLRGRSALPAPVQAAQHHARLAVQDFAISALPPLHVDQPEPGRWQVRLDRRPGVVDVELRSRLSVALPHLTCAVATPQRVRVFDLVSLRIG